jgi:hypothetical protein
VLRFGPAAYSYTEIGFQKFGQDWRTGITTCLKIVSERRRDYRIWSNLLWTILLKVVAKKIESIRTPKMTIFLIDIMGCGFTSLVGLREKREMIVMIKF